jgi:allophanate hydrolase
MDWHPQESSFDLAQLGTSLASGLIGARDVADAVLLRLDASSDEAIWIARVCADELRAQAERLDRRAAQQGRENLPLFGVPFAIKDNIDVQGMPTTAACPAFSYVAQATATVVQRLLDAGALLVGKTNLDQFATGLVGLRSPYGAPRNPFDARILPGGSSSGSAVAVARGLVSFALGTDTAGSGRVPAALNNVVGLKPSRGLLSGYGVVPACRSLDCVSVFALTVHDSMRVASIAAGVDANDPFIRAQAATQQWAVAAKPQAFRFGVPNAAHLEFFGDTVQAACFETACAQLVTLGGTPVEIDFQVFRDAAALLYQGPWVAERLQAAGTLLANNPAAIHPDVRAAISAAWRFSAQDSFAAYYRLKALRRAAQALLAGVDFLLVPSLARVYSVADVAAAPQEVNSRLGYYTNFVNLLDLCAIASPAAMRADGVPFGVTLIGPAFTEARLAAIAAALHQSSGVPLGATAWPLPANEIAMPPAPQGRVRVCVVGAHLSGLPLNHQLQERGATLLRATTTSPCYRLYALEHFAPPRPGMLRSESGAAIAVEVWEMPTSEFGGFVAAIPAPLGIGQVELADGEQLCGFLCEPYALSGARDITHHGGWRGYLAARHG